MRAARACWRRCAASVTGFGRKYRDDVFVRTEANIIALQIVYALLILGLTVGALLVLYHEIVNGMLAIMEAALSSREPLSPEAIVTALETVRTREITGSAALIFSTAVVFGYLVARAALAPARSSLAAQKQFIGNIAHELRTPLSIIKTNTEVQLIDSSMPEAAREVHESNLEELDRISDIINNLLSLNALIKPERMKFEAVELGTLAHRVAEKLAPMAEKKKLEIAIQAAEHSFVRGNSTALEQVLMNIARNAIAYTPAGTITVRVGPDDEEHMEISVEDTGPGIKKADLDRIFEPFYRGDSARTRSGGTGSGLGLAIVSELVKLHRGKIRIRSTEGRGTTVFVTLPADRQARARYLTEGESSEISADFSKAPEA